MHMLRVRRSEATDEIDDGNEDTGVSELKIEVYGCQMPAVGRPVCGDGLIMRPEQCDLGIDTETNVSLNN
jgi:hypothetical protein